MEDDLKKYEVQIDTLPEWYYETIKEFILNYCPTMHPTNKAILLELLNCAELKPTGNSKVIELKRKAV
ncbi:hypothetical protein KAR91_83265 [Candidatus Pacearchaeota archaeon]|nr:hypothetical protein [Candidatus Pacearchaeota archaeon]